ncbi:MAG: hypothetical protein AAGH42_04905 [Pseudomonadota bacterium]
MSIDDRMATPVGGDHEGDHPAPRQYPLFEPASVPDYRSESYILTAQTEQVIATLKAWQGSIEPLLALCGPVASGKTHLAHMMRDRLGRPNPASNDPLGTPLLVCASTVLARPALEYAEKAALIIDEAEGFAAAPRQLLDLVEASREQGQRLVLVGRGDPAHWAATQKDLYTRIQAMPRVVVPEPDEGLIRAVIMRHLRARQLAFSPADLARIAERAARHIPCTFAAAALFTRALDLEALGTGKKPSQKIVGAVLDTYFPA